MTDNIKVAFAKFGPDLFDVRHFSIREAISDLFEISLACVSHREDIPFDSLVGKEAALYIDGTKVRVWAGVVAEITQVHGELPEEKKKGGATSASSYQITIVPNLWRATQRKNSRVFQHLTTPAIVQKLLGEWGIVPELKLTATYKPHEYCVQYQETDYAFFCRILEESGISFFFSHEKTSGSGAEITKLVLNDAPQKNPVYGEKLALVSSHQMNIGVPFFACASVAITQRLRPGKFAIRDFDFRRPLTTPILATATVGDSPMHEDKLEQYHYVTSAFWWEQQPGGGTPIADDRGIARTDPKEADAKIPNEKDTSTVLIKREMDAERQRRKLITFRTNAIDLQPGSIVGINQNATDTHDHPRKELAPDKKLLVYETHFDGHSHGDWVQRVSAVFAEYAFHPERRTPRPRIVGVQSAIVVGPKGKEIWTDEFGRVRLQFHWDREGQYDDASTCWVRVSDAWAGNGFGSMHHPRVGHEVLVEFFGGDPDQPVVVGRLYNNTSYGGALAPGVPYQLPDHQTRSGIKTDSSAGGRGYNELYFEDAKGDELIHVQAEKNLSYVVNETESSSIGGSRSIAIGSSDSIDVGKSRAVTVGKVYKTSIGEVYTVSVAKQTTIQMIDQTIVETTGKASLSLAGGTIWLNADGIHMKAGTAFEVTTQSNRIIVQGGPHVRINEAGAGPAPTPAAAAPAGKPSPPPPGGTSGSPYKPNGGTSLAKPGNTQDVNVDTGADPRKPGGGGAGGGGAAGAGAAAKPKPAKNITFPKNVCDKFKDLWKDSFPGGHSSEHGGVLVTDAAGATQIVNAGGGLTPAAGSFDPDLNIPAGDTLQGVFHTHPYDKTEGSYTNVSLSGGDAAYMINTNQQMIVAKSGDGLYVYKRTAQTPANVDFEQTNNDQNARIAALTAKGMTFDKASRIAALETANRLHLEYYQGKGCSAMQVN